MARSRGQGGVYLRGQTWWVYYSADGKQHHESSRSKIKKDAVALLKSRQGSITEGKPVESLKGKLKYDALMENLEATTGTRGVAQLTR